MRTVTLSTAPARRVALVAGVVALLAAAGCSHEDPTTLGAPVAPAGTSSSAGSPAAHPTAVDATSAGTGSSSHAANGTGTSGSGSGSGSGSRDGSGSPGGAPAADRLTAPTAYRIAVMGIPQLHIGSADIATPVPAGWPVRATVPPPDQQLYGNATGTFDRRDPSGALLVRVAHEPNRQPTDILGLTAAIDHYRSLPGATVHVTVPVHTDNTRLGLLRAEWTVDVPVGGRSRHALVSAWLLNNQVITVYVSVPRGAEALGHTLYAHATDLTITIHPGPDAG
jgi:hypothetical protein